LSAVSRGPERATALRYFETSALLAAMMEGDADAAASISADGAHVASALTFAEGYRAIVRARAMGRFDAAHERDLILMLGKFEKRCDIINISDAILTGVRRPLPVEPIRTLDAIHLVSVESLGELPQFVIIVTRDARVKANALALGYAVE